MVLIISIYFVVWILRSSLKLENNFEKSSEKRISEITLVKLSNQVQPNKYLKITDMQLFDDEKMHLIVTGLNEAGYFSYRLKIINIVYIVII